ncbi:MAG: stage II sporulation protein M [Ectothiorhodospiraceae bacterium]|nr:stage II sporulation protein M [Ectothiorhodospiraceae bacterium]
MSGSDGLRRWLEKRQPAWEKLARALRTQRDNRRQDVVEVHRLDEGYRALARDLALARSIDPKGRLTRYLEALYVEAHEAVHKPARRLLPSTLTLVRRDLPAAMGALRPTVLSVAAWFLLSALFGWLLVMVYPDLAALFASQQMIEGVQDGELWTDGLLNIIPPSMLALSIMTNNILVALTAYALGALFGLGTLYIIGLNGMMLGSVFAFVRHYGLDDRLFEFVIAHGPVELSVICVAGAAGVRLGEALLRPGNLSRTAALRHAVGQTTPVMCFCVLFLVAAGLIEGYVSPSPNIALGTKVAVGVASWVVFYAVMSGRAWPAARYREHKNQSAFS